MLKKDAVSEKLLSLGYNTKVCSHGVKVKLPIYLFSSIEILNTDNTFKIVPKFGNVKRNIGIYIDIFVSVAAGIVIATDIEISIVVKAIIISILFLACIWDIYRYKKTEQVSNLIENIISDQY